MIEHISAEMLMRWYSRRADDGTIRTNVAVVFDRGRREKLIRAVPMDGEGCNLCLRSAGGHHLHAERWRLSTSPYGNIRTTFTIRVSPQIRRGMLVTG